MYIELCVGTGLVNIEIEVKDRILNFSVSPVHAAIIMQFEKQGTRNFLMFCFVTNVAYSIMPFCYYCTCIMTLTIKSRYFLMNSELHEISKNHRYKAVWPLHVHKSFSTLVKKMKFCVCQDDIESDQNKQCFYSTFKCNSSFDTINW